MAIELLAAEWNNSQEAMHISRQLP